MKRIISASILGLSTIGLVVLIMTATSNEAQGPPGGLDVTVINPASQPVPVTGSLGVMGEANVNVVNTPEVEVTNIPDVQSVEIVNAPQMAGARLNFSLTDPESDDVLMVPNDALLTDLVITVPPNARCLFSIYEGDAVNFENILFRLGLGGASASNIYEMHLQSGLPGSLTFQVIMAGVQGQVCSGQLFWRGFST